VSFEAEASFIRSHFNNLWAGRTAVAWDNVPFSKPDAAWVRLSVNRDGAARRELGSTATRRFIGTTLVEVFTQANTGTAENDELCEVVASIFRDVTDADTHIHFGEPEVLSVGNSDGWFKQDVLCPFARDTVYTT